MALLTHLKTLLPTHLFTLSNVGTLVTDDEGDSPDPTRISSTPVFGTSPVCEGFTHSLVSGSSDNNTTRLSGATMQNRSDINGGNGGGNNTSSFNYNTGKRTVHLWFSGSQINSPTCLYKQGGDANNFAFVLGIAKTITWQAADDDQPFLVAQSNFQVGADRAYFVCGIWHHHSELTGTSNQIQLFVNGILQETVTHPNATENFPPHIGYIGIGNCRDELKTYNNSSLPFAAREKRLNLLGMYNNVALTQAQMRDIFERTVIPEVVIEADTVANQQVALDALSGARYRGKNCAIRIIQATGVTDYRLFVDNIMFEQDSNLGDIAVQYVGANTLTLENTNGSNVVVTSTPAEVETATAVLPGGGTIAIVEDTKRVSVTKSYDGITAKKLAISAGGLFNLQNLNVSEVENVSGNDVIVSVDNPIATITDTDGSTQVRYFRTLTLKGVVDSSVYLRNGSSETTIFGENETGDYSVAIPPGVDGVWTWVVSRPGYEKVTGNIPADAGFSQNIIYTPKLDFGNGLPSYTGMSSANVSFDVVGEKVVGAFIGDVSAQFLFDELETFLSTKKGCQWLSNNRNALIVRFGTNFAGQILVLPDNVAVQSNSAGAKKLASFVITTERPFDRSLLGSVVFNKSETSGDISGAVWAYLASVETVNGSMKEMLQNVKAHALAANTQTQKVSEE